MTTAKLLHNPALVFSAHLSQAAWLSVCFASQPICIHDRPKLNSLVQIAHMPDFLGMAAMQGILQAAKQQVLSCVHLRLCHGLLACEPHLRNTLYKVLHGLRFLSAPVAPVAYSMLLDSKSVLHPSCKHAYQTTADLHQTELLPLSSSMLAFFIWPSGRRWHSEK